MAQDDGKSEKRLAIWEEMRREGKWESFRKLRDALKRRGVGAWDAWKISRNELIKPGVMGPQGVAEADYLAAELFLGVYGAGGTGQVPEPKPEKREALPLPKHEPGVIGRGSVQHGRRMERLAAERARFKAEQERLAAEQARADVAAGPVWNPAAEPVAGAAGPPMAAVVQESRRRVVDTRIARFVAEPVAGAVVSTPAEAAGGRRVVWLEDAEWVYQHMGQTAEGIPAAEIRSPGALEWLRMCQADIKAKMSFYTGAVEKLLPNRTQVEQLSKMSDDGRALTELLEKLERAGEEAEAYGASRKAAPLRVPGV